MTSLWLDRDLPSYPQLEQPARFDVAVVGAGLTGLSTALLFARAGCSVVVLEGRRVGAATTGNTTGKVSLLQGTRLSEILRRHGTETLRHYVTAHAEGQQWLLNYCAEHEVPVQRRPAYTYAQTESGVAAIEKELHACETAGLGARWIDDVPLPSPAHAAVGLDDQAQLDPMDLLVALADDLRRHGGVIVEETRVRGLRVRGGPVLHTAAGDVHAEHVVVATGMPIFDRGTFFARMHPERSYALAFRTRTEAVDGMYLSADSPKRSLRTASYDGAEYLVVGGNGHVTGREAPTSERFVDLERWTHRYFGDVELTHTWSAQDHSTAAGLPYAGPLAPFGQRVLMAGGYHKWGITGAVAAAHALTSRVLGSSAPWAEAMSSWGAPGIHDVVAAGRINAGVAFEMGRGWLAPLSSRGQGETPAERQGEVRLEGTQPTAVSTVDGRTRRLSAICPHLGGIVRWNDAECSWDCPLHGSRFDAEGRVLDGPATTGLKER